MIDCLVLNDDDHLSKSSTVHIMRAGHPVPTSTVLTLDKMRRA